MAVALALALPGWTSRAMAENQAAPTKPPVQATKAIRAAKPPSEAVGQLTRWVSASGDNNGRPFMVIDKIDARVFVFDRKGTLLGTTPALIGSAQGDHSVEGVGDRELSDIKPEDRTTPAGRFVSGFGRASGNRQVLWIDYPASISLHPVVTAKKKQRRLQRLQSSTPEDNRITYGCINVSPAFYQKVVSRHFRKSNGIIYILPDTRPIQDIFPTFRPVAQLNAGSKAIDTPLLQ